jgi:DNA-directed RNA polymerase subunit alpha
MTTDETMTEVARLIDHGDLDVAEKQLSAIASGNQSSPKWWMLKGRVETRQGQLQLGTESLEKAIELDPSDPDALFGLAYVCDLHGDDERAVELYQQCVSTPPVRVNAMINLAVIYEDRGEYEEAESCLRKVLKSYPNHERATLFLKDVLSSQDMYYDEDLERTREEHDAVLDIPISDFELSVRSRNCLKKMDIHTLGDLLNTTEPELLSYKNFGETSLNEIKAMLRQKRLRLGQLLEERSGRTTGETAEPPSSGDQAVMNRPVSELELSVRARKCLQRLGILTLGELVSRTESELLSSKNFGDTSLQEIKLRLEEHSLSLRKLDPV